VFSAWEWGFNVLFVDLNGCRWLQMAADDFALSAAVL